MNDQEHNLIQAARNGDQAAIGELVQQYQKRVFALAVRMCPTPELAEEAAQEAFLAAWQGLPFFRGDSAFATWLYRLTRNVCIDFLRAQKRRQTVPLHLNDDEGETELPLPDTAEGPEERAVAGERRRALAQAMQALSPEHREILTLRVIEDLPYEQIAQILGVRTGTVKSRLARARISLKNILKSGNQMNLFSSEESVEEVTLP